MTDRSDEEPALQSEGEPTRRKDEKPTKDESAPVSQLPRDANKEREARLAEVARAEADAYQITVRLEPDLAGSTQQEVMTLSIAISLKRIADALEAANAK